MANLGSLSNEALLTQTENLVRNRARTSAVLIEHIAEIDRRRAYREAGYPSLHAYCVGKLGMSDEVAFKRVRNARLCREFPIILDYLRDHRIHLRGMTLLAPHMTSENAAELLEAAAGKTRTQIESMLAARFPKPVPASQIRKLPTRSPARFEVSASNTEQPRAPSTNPERSLGAPTNGEGIMAFEHAPTPARRSAVSPISASEYKVQFVADEEARRYLEQLRDMLRHTISDGDIAEICKLALKELHAKVLKKRFGVGTRRRSKPRATSLRSSGDARSRHIPAAVRARVYERDGGRCTFVSADGTRCGTAELLQFDHFPHPWAKGGKHTAENLRLRCRAHNQLAAEREYGRKFMDGKRKAGKEVEPGSG